MDLVRNYFIFFNSSFKFLFYSYNYSTIPKSLLFFKRWGFDFLLLSCGDKAWFYFFSLLLRFRFMELFFVKIFVKELWLFFLGDLDTDLDSLLYDFSLCSIILFWRNFCISPCRFLTNSSNYLDLIYKSSFLFLKN